MDYKEKYEKLKEYLANLRPYCDNCQYSESDPDGYCDDCHRKYFNWKFKKELLDRI